MIGLELEPGEHVVTIYSADALRRAWFLVTRKPSGLVLMITWSQRGLVSAIPFGREPDDEKIVAKLEQTLARLLQHARGDVRLGRIDIGSADPVVIREKLAKVEGFGHLHVGRCR